MRLAKLSLSDEKEIADIMNIEIDEDVRATPQDMRINEDLPTGVKKKTRAHDLFEKYYANAQKPLNPAVENTMKLTLTNNKPFSCTPHRLSYNEKSKLRRILDDLTIKASSERVRQSMPHRSF